MSTFISKRHTADWIFTLVLFGVFIFYLELAEPYYRPFKLSNPAIQHEFAEHQIVTDGNLYLLTYIIPLAIMLVLSKVKSHSAKQFSELLGVTLLAVILNLGLTGFITDVLKIWVSRPRPDFIARCNAPSSTPFDKYVTVSVCKPSDAMKIVDGMKSFPSGHSSIAFSGAIFFCLWVNGQFALYRRHAPIYKQFLSWIFLLVAAFVAISRSIDYRHHTEDIVCGSLIGLLVGTFVYFKYFPSLTDENPGLLKEDDLLPR